MVTRADTLYAEVTAAWGGVKNHKLDDSQWVCVGPDGKSLQLYNKPTTIWERFVEWLSRIFVLENKYHALCRTVRDLTYSLDQYLQAETDEQRLTTFLGDYTSAFNVV